MIRQGKDPEIYLSRHKTIPKTTDTGNNKDSTVEEVELQTVYIPFLLWVLES